MRAVPATPITQHGFNCGFGPPPERRLPTLVPSPITRSTPLRKRKMPESRDVPHFPLPCTFLLALEGHFPPPLPPPVRLWLSCCTVITAEMLSSVLWVAKNVKFLCLPLWSSAPASDIKDFTHLLRMYVLLLVRFTVHCNATGQWVSVTALQLVATLPKSNRAADPSV